MGPTKADRLGGFVGADPNASWARQQAANGLGNRSAERIDMNHKIPHQHIEKKRQNNIICDRIRLFLRSILAKIMHGQ
jgi:hypothetical protein